MGAKKKKSLANRLAKMSDDERARYLQHRADMEEEARRRKEQLISTFLKNKIKKEDGFARLNAAKINSEWHQILRQIKCKEMKDEVEHIKKYIERVLENKNNTIEKLMQELNEAEELYTMNFQAHLVNINKMIEFSYKSVEEMNEIYEEDRDKIIEIWSNERKDYLENALDGKTYLKTVIYQQENMGKQLLRSEYEGYFRQSDDIVRENKKEFDEMRRGREATICDLWRQIAELLRSHVETTDKKRAHLAELQTLDAESASEIVINEDNIHKQEVEISVLENRYENFKRDREEEIKFQKKKVEDLKKEFLLVKIQHKKNLDLDEKQLLCLTNKSNEVIKFLEENLKRGEVILNLCQICRKYETPKERILRFNNPVDRIISIDDDYFKPDDDNDDDPKMNEVVDDCRSTSISKDDLKTRKYILRWRGKTLLTQRTIQNVSALKEDFTKLPSEDHNSEVSASGIDEFNIRKDKILKSHVDSFNESKKSYHESYQSSKDSSSKVYEFSDEKSESNVSVNDSLAEVQELNYDNGLDVQKYDDVKLTTHKFIEQSSRNEERVAFIHEKPCAIKNQPESQDKDNSLIYKSGDTLSDYQDINKASSKSMLEKSKFTKHGSKKISPILPEISSRLQLTTSLKSLYNFPKQTLTLETVKSKSAEILKRRSTSSSTSSSMKKSERSTRSKTCLLVKRKGNKLPSSSSSSFHSSSSQNFGTKYFENVSLVEPIWINYNKVRINCLEMRKALKQLEEENVRMKQEIRKLLELNAIEQIKIKDVVQVEDVFQKYVHKEIIGRIGVYESKILNRMKINVI